MDPTAQAFAQVLPEASREAFAAAKTEAAVRAVWVRACAARGDFGADEVAYLRHVARRMPEPARPESLENVNAGDLLLAFACLQHTAAALRAFDHEYGAVIEHARRGAGVELDAGEFRQRVYQRVLVADDAGPPRLAAYRGSGPLKTWVRMVSARMAIDERRRPRAPPALCEVSLLPDDASGELGLLRREYGEDFRAAFRAAIEALSPQRRALLRMRYLHGMSVTHLAKTQDMHRVTMSRLLTTLRQELLDAIVAAVADRRGVPPSEVASVLQLVRSRLDVSLSALDY